MANKQKGQMTLRVGKQRYHLELCVEAMCEFEEFSDAQSATGIGRTWDDVTDGIKLGRLRDVRLFFWVALRTHHPDIATLEPTSIKAVSKIMDGAGATKIQKALLTLFTLNSQGKRDEQEEQEGAPATVARPPDAQVGTGTGSSPTH